MLPNDEYLNSLPKKRIGAGCLIMDEQERILLVKPTYKPVWEIPGGVLSACDIESIRLPADELSEYRFFAPGALPKEMTTSLHHRILAAFWQVPSGCCVYLEDQH